MRFRAVLSASGLLSLCLTTLATGQNQQTFQDTLEVQLHNLDAIVTDRAGHPVRGLTKSDFIVLENGIPQDITNFSFYDIGTATVAIPTGSSELVATPDQTTLPDTAPPPRRFIFFVDEMAMQGNVRNNLKKQIATVVRSMRPGDLATVVRPTGTAKIVQDYTGDIAQVEKTLNKAIDSCKVTITAPAFADQHRFRRALQHAESPSEVAYAKRTYVESQKDRVTQRISQLRALIASLTGAEEKKILILITSGLNAQPGREVYSTEEQLAIMEMSKPQASQTSDGQPASDLIGLGGMGTVKVVARMEADRANTGWRGTFGTEISDFKSDIDDLGRIAAAEGVTIYALTPEIPLHLDDTRGADARSSGSSILGSDIGSREVVPSEMLAQLLQYEGETLTSLADRTGGRWFRGTGVIDDTFRAIDSDLKVYYSLAYRSRGEGRKARKVVVKVKDRPELQVRTRSEVIDSSGGDMGSRVIAGLLYPREVNDLKMLVKTETPRKEGRKSFNVPVEVVIPVDRITFLRGSDGMYKGQVAVYYAAAAEKEFISYGKQEQLIELTPQQYQDMIRIKYRYTSNITVPKGSVRIAFGVVDTTSKLSSLQTVNVTAQ